MNECELTRLFTHYKNHLIDEHELIYRLEQTHSKLNDKGVVYTPKEIVDAMIALAQPTPEESIIEPSCGHGSFVVGLLLYMQKNHQLHGESLLHWFITKVTGIDINPNSVFELRQLLCHFFSKHFNMPVAPTTFDNIRQADSLSQTSHQHYDLCIGNPPYIHSRDINPSYLKFLKEHFVSCQKGNIDIYYAFLEKFITNSERLVFITPSSFLTNQFGQTIKEKVTQHLHTLIDFKTKQVFNHVNTYTCILYTNKLTHKDTFLYGNTPDSLTVKHKSQLLTNQNNNQLAPILTGIATLCDAIYKVKKKTDGTFIAHYNNKDYEIEEDILLPYLKLTKIKSQVDIHQCEYLIFPYNKKTNQIISEDTLKQTFPKTYRYLLAVKERLLQRDKGKTDNYEAWYAYGRKQGFHTIQSDTALIIPKMMPADHNIKVITLSRAIKHHDRFLFTSGYIIPVTNDNKAHCLALLSEQFNHFLIENGKQWPSKRIRYYSLTVNQLKRFSPKPTIKT